MPSKRRPGLREVIPRGSPRCAHHAGGLAERRMIQCVCVCVWQGKRGQTKLLPEGGPELGSPCSL